MIPRNEFMNSRLRKKQKHFLQHYDDLFDFVYKYIRYRLAGDSSTDDVVSETFLKAYEQLERFDEARGSLRQWMTGIAKNQLLMHWRKQKVEIGLDDIDFTLADESQINFVHQLSHQVMLEK